jgi:hypothetical protein
MRYLCFGCEREGEYDDFIESKDWYQRLVEGDIVTDRECPQCHALAVPIQPLLIQFTPRECAAVARALATAHFAIEPLDNIIQNTLETHFTGDHVSRDSMDYREADEPHPDPKVTIKGYCTTRGAVEFEVEAVSVHFDIHVSKAWYCEVPPSSQGTRHLKYEFEESGFYDDETIAEMESMMFEIAEDAIPNRQKFRDKAIRKAMAELMIARNSDPHNHELREAATDLNNAFPELFLGSMPPVAPAKSLGEHMEASKR